MALGVVGPLVQETPVNVVALNGADHGLHLLSGLLLVATALVADKAARTTRV